MDRNLHEKIITSTFKSYAEIVWIYIKDSHSKGANYDPYRNTGQTTSNQNPLPVKAIVRQIQANSLIMRELGLTISGALELIIKETDVVLIKLAQKCKYNNIEYSIYNKALGNRVQIYKRPFGFFRIVLFRVGK